MKALIISSSSIYSLSPIADARDICTLQIMGKPIIYHISKYLEGFGITSVQYCANLNFSEYLTEGETVIMLDVNTLTSFDLRKLLKFHTSDTAVTAVLDSRGTSSDSTGIILNRSGFAEDLTSAAYRKIPFSHPLGGIYAVTLTASLKKALSGGETNGAELIKSCLAAGVPVKGLVAEAEFMQIRTVFDYMECHSKIMDGSLPVKTDANLLRDGLWIEDGAELSDGVILEAPSYISSDCKIERGARIESNTYVGRGCVIRKGARLSRSIVGQCCCISENADISGAVLADSISIGTGCRISENAVIGSGCRLEYGCCIGRSVKIWPNKRVGAKVRLNDSLIRASFGTERLLKNSALRGEINVDITPEFMAKLGSAAGTLFSDSKFGISYDSSPACAMLAQAMCAGLTSTGCELCLFGEQTLPVMRSGIRYYHLCGGVHINQNSADGVFFPEITFISGSGAGLDSRTERALEDIFFGNMFLRCGAEKLKDSVDYSGYKTVYRQKILNGLKSQRFSRNMEIRTVSETVSESLEVILSEIERLTDTAHVREFEADIDRSGQHITLYSSDGSIIDRNTYLSICAILLVEYFGSNAASLPVSAPKSVTDMLKDSGVEITECGASDEDLLCSTLENKLYDQFRLCFDGVYAAITLLDYLNSRDMSFDSLLKRIPTSSMHESEIECADIKKNDVIRQLYEKYSDGKTDLTDGIKIYQSNGWVLIIPEKYRHCIKVITEGYTTEAAKELSTIFTNQIKRLAKPN